MWGLNNRNEMKEEGEGDLFEFHCGFCVTLSGWIRIHMRFFFHFHHKLQRGCILLSSCSSDFFLFPVFNFKHFALLNLLLVWNFDDIKGEKIHSSLTKSEQCFIAGRNAFWSYCLMIVCVMCKITCFVVILHYLELLFHVKVSLH